MERLSAINTSFMMMVFLSFEWNFEKKNYRTFKKIYKTILSEQPLQNAFNDVVAPTWRDCARMPDVEREKHFKAKLDKEA